jgi:hypothetical protein
MVFLAACAMNLMPASLQAVELTPVPFSTVLQDYGSRIGEGEEPLQGLFGIDDTTDAVLAGELLPLGSSVIVLLDDGGPGLPGFVVYHGADGALVRTDFEATGESSWWIWELVGVHAGDWNGDGCTDLTIEADCMTGIGPEGSMPFPWTAVLLWDPDRSAFILQPDPAP